MFHPQIILHPTDFSDCSACAFQIAVDLARQHGARLLVLYVVETLGAENVTYGEVASQLEPESYRRRLQDYLDRSLPSMPRDLVVEHLLVEGDPAQEIVRIAQEQLCDLIVMGTHGHRGLERLLLGSVAEKVVRNAPCPVLTSKIRSPE